MPNFIFYLIIFLGGVTSLSWQVLWQLDLSLSLGVSARGTALTVATVMAGLALGARVMAKRIVAVPPKNPWQVYGLLEISIGLFGTLPRLLKPMIEAVDTESFNIAPFAATPVTLLLLCLAIGPSSILMGCTIPIIGMISSSDNNFFSRYYAVNTAGAGLGCLLISFLLLPFFGRSTSALILITIQGLVCLTVLKILPKNPLKIQLPQIKRIAPAKLSLIQATVLGLISGITTFMLEVAWFRLLRASWLSTTDSFAIMLFVFLLALALGSWLSRRAQEAKLSVSKILITAAVLIWIATPLVERFDLWGNAGGSYLTRISVRVLTAFAVMGPPIAVMGLLLPRLLDAFPPPRQLAQIYGWNTLGSVVGSLMAGWIFLEWVGPVATSWIAAALLAFASIGMTGSFKKKLALVSVTLLGMAFSFLGQSGVGTVRVQGPTSLVRKDHILVEHINGADVTTSVVKVAGGHHVLFIDGYAATGEFGASTAYMDSMGRLPMLLHPDPQSALIICFGTGQTTNAVRLENPKYLTVVDVNPATYDLARHFQTNQNVLGDKRVKALTMDGRAWLRRSPEIYDVVTLEPMPPSFAGSNSLYSVEFYKLIFSRLSENGCLAQWFPLHLLSPSQARSVASAFCQVFPNSVLWIDPSHQGGVQAILLGQKGTLPWDQWPGFARQANGNRPLSKDQINRSIFLMPEELEKYTTGQIPVTDDNQLLSYGTEGIHRADLSKRSFSAENQAILLELKASVK